MPRPTKRQAAGEQAAAKRPKEATDVPVNDQQLATKMAMQDEQDELMRTAICSNDDATIDELFKQGYNVRRRSRICNFFILACTEKKWSTLLKFLDEDVTGISETDEKGVTLLMYTMIFMSVPTFFKLLDLGADPHVTSSKGYNVLLLASKYGAPMEVLATLAKFKVNPNTEDYGSKTALIYELCNNVPAVTTNGYSKEMQRVKLLIAMGASTSHRDASMFTVPMYAIALHYEKLDLIKLIINSNADLTVMDNHGENVLFHVFRLLLPVDASALQDSTTTYFPKSLTPSVLEDHLVKRMYFSDQKCFPRHRLVNEIMIPIIEVLLNIETSENSLLGPTNGYRTLGPFIINRHSIIYKPGFLSLLFTFIRYTINFYEKFIHPKTSIVPPVFTYPQKFLLQNMIINRSLYMYQPFDDILTLLLESQMRCVDMVIPRIRTLRFEMGQDSLDTTSRKNVIGENYISHFDKMIFHEYFKPIANEAYDVLDCFLERLAVNSSRNKNFLEYQTIKRWLVRLDKHGFILPSKIPDVVSPVSLLLLLRQKTLGGFETAPWDWEYFSELLTLSLKGGVHNRHLEFHDEMLRQMYSELEVFDALWIAGANYFTFPFWRSLISLWNQHPLSLLLFFKPWAARSNNTIYTKYDADRMGATVGNLITLFVGIAGPLPYGRVHTLVVKQLKKLDKILQYLISLKKINDFNKKFYRGSDSISGLFRKCHDEIPTLRHLSSCAVRKLVPSGIEYPEMLAKIVPINGLVDELLYKVPSMYTMHTTAKLDWDEPEVPQSENGAQHVNEAGFHGAVAVAAAGAAAGAAAAVAAAAAAADDSDTESFEEEFSRSDEEEEGEAEGEND